MATTASDVRVELVRALRLDLVGPHPGSQHENESLDQQPSRYYLTGFLIPYEPKEAKELKRRQERMEDDQLNVFGKKGVEDDAQPEQASGRKAHFPSSIGLSVLVGAQCQVLEVLVTWGDYKLTGGSESADEGEKKGGTSTRARGVWKRTPRTAQVRVPVAKPAARSVSKEIPDSGGLRIVTSVRPAPGMGSGDVDLIPKGTRSVSVFLVNQREPGPDGREDEALVFQATLSLRSEVPFERRPNPRGAATDDPDERIADLQYRDVAEYAVGHGVAAEALREPDKSCREVRTTWIPEAAVEKVDPADVKNVELSMEKLASAESPSALKTLLEGLTSQYGSWIDTQKAGLPREKNRSDVGQTLMKEASRAKDRIAGGIKALEAPDIFDAFRIANRTMAAAARQRDARSRGIAPEQVPPPRWRPFQLAFVLLNLRGIAEPKHEDRDAVDLLFFPTGGGKTEAYLGLAAFCLVLRRLRNPGMSSAGVSVLMRYTLRLLTIDQLTRAAALICALEIERKKDERLLGPWPFEIGLWVGLAATPNEMGRKGDKRDDTARSRTNRFKDDDRRPSPIPLENCPWCDRRFARNSFTLVPNDDAPTDLRIVCVNPSCAFTRDNPLPILAVDEPIYRRVPCFIIATVDKFAALPWVGRSGALFGNVDRGDKDGFYGPCDPNRGRVLEKPLLPPDLIIQDELHLISGPLGTIAGLYEAAIDELCTRKTDAQSLRPKIVASTATVRRAESQIRALFGRTRVHVFPPPGPDRRNSFFAMTKPPTEKNPRLYLGIAAQGRSMKVVLLRTYLALLGAGQRAYRMAGGDKTERNPADPYMTLLGYFNSLRELGGSRRIVEDEISSRLTKYGSRRRVGEAEGAFADREIDIGRIVEMTSRESTARVSDARRRLGLAIREKERVDVALATNMISVGLDITRLGLMVVLGQPKTTAEYIQATSRVGRDEQKPGLVVTLLNLYKPRDRSHYERFEAYHESFYRAVEATSVTPFSPRAIDRAIAGVTVALVRHICHELTPPRGAGEIGKHRVAINSVADVLGQRAEGHRPMSREEAEERRRKVRDTVIDLLDSWERIAVESGGAGLQYQREVGQAPPLLLDPLDPELPRKQPHERKFRAHRSMRDVEPAVNLWVDEAPDLEEDL